MIFITLGSQKFQFNRLLNKIDMLIEQETIKDKVFAQRGYSDYKPLNYAYEDFLNRDDFQIKLKESDIVITHAGTGAIIGAVKAGKKVIAVPRLKKYDEHVDDHQVQIVKQFSEMGIIEPCYDVDDLDKAYDKVLSTEYKEYVSNTNVIIKSIVDYLEK